MKNILLICTLFSAITSLCAQSYTISGTVKDASTGESLLGASVYDTITRQGVATNEYGFFSLTLKKGKHVLVVSYIGYKNFVRELNLNSDYELKAGLEPSGNALQEVALTYNRITKSQLKPVISGSVDLSPKDIKALPALLGEADVTRTVLAQSGVSSIGEGASGFNVRGGDIDQNLILLDEAPVYNSSHVLGFFSVFNADAIKGMKLYKGTIPARFGGRASSVLDVRQREGSDKKFKGQGGIGLLFSRLTLEGPIQKNKLSFLVSGRRSYFDLAFPLFKEIKNDKVYFYDLSTKLSWSVDDKDKLFFSGYFGADVVRVKDDESNMNVAWKNRTATVRWNHLFSDRLFMNLSGIYSRYTYTLDFASDKSTLSEDLSNDLTWESAVENWLFKPDFTFYQNPNTKIRFGVHNTLYRFSPAKVTGALAGHAPVVFPTKKRLEVAPYASLDKTWNKLSLLTGLRYSWFGALSTSKEAKRDTSYHGFEPRVALKYNLTDRSSLKLGYSRLFQYVHLIYNTNATLPWDIWQPAGDHIRPLETNQLSLGYAHDTQDKAYSFSAEAYYKTFKDLIAYKNGAKLFLNKALERELLPADGYTYGLELGAYKLKGNFTGNINYTYSVNRKKTTSEVGIDNLNDGAYFPSNYDRPHILNLTLNYKFNERWKLVSFFTYQTGRPVTYPTGKLEIDRQPYFAYSKRNAYRTSPIHRLDISFTYTPAKKPNRRWHGSWAFGVYNAYGHQNPIASFSVLKDNRLKTFETSVIGAAVPFVTYNFKF